MRAELMIGAGALCRAAPAPSAAGLNPSIGEDETQAILDSAAAHSLTYVHASPYFGDAERLLGRSWPFPSPFKVFTETLSLAEGLDRVEIRARRSLDLMGLPRAFGLLASDAEELLAPNGAELWRRMEALKAAGLYQNIGFSATADSAPALLAKRFKPDWVQVPISLLDQRLVVDGTLERLNEQGVKVIARSVFHHGALFGPTDILPTELAALAPHLSRFRRSLAEAGADPLHAALSFALDLPGVASVVVDVQSAGELRAVFAASMRPAPDLDWEAFALSPSLLRQAA